MVTLRELGTPVINNWCPGCGNFGILTSIKGALVELGLEREEVVLISGIGCHGKMTNYVKTNGVHTIHGRTLPVATGIKLTNPDLTVICHAGDGDCYDEGWGHFAHAIRRNIDITLIVHDNMIFGLTTGQVTATSQEGFRTRSTPHGSIPPPLNPVAHTLVSNGTFVARGFAGDPKHLQKLIVEAIRHRGFSFVDVFQPCVTWNYLNTYQWFRERVYELEETEHDVTDRGKALEKSFEWGDRIPIGVFYKEDRPTYRDNLPHIKGRPLTGLDLTKIDMSSLIKDFM